MVTLIINHAAGGASTVRDACTHSSTTADKAPARESVAMPPVIVNGVTIPRKAIAAEVQNFPAANPGEGWRAAARALVIREVLLQESRRIGIPEAPQTDDDGRRETVEDALVRGLIEHEVRVPEVDEELLRRFYDNNCRRFMSPALYEADHILIAARRDDAQSFAAAREKASSLRSMLTTAPEQFEALARDWSDCPSNSLGGSLGQIKPGETTLEFEAALARLDPGEISAPVETRYGVHLIRLVRRIDGGQLPFDAMRTRIAAYLVEHVRRQAMAQYVAILVGRAEISGIEISGTSSPLVQ